jgi:hypothetical protein
MEILYPRCAGLDVHKDMVMARVRCVSEPAVDETRRFATTTGALIELQEWLARRHTRGDGGDGGVLEARVASAGGAL